MSRATLPLAVLTAVLLVGLWRGSFLTNDEPDTPPTPPESHKLSKGHETGTRDEINKNATADDQAQPKPPQGQDQGATTQPPSLKPGENEGPKFTLPSASSEWTSIPTNKPSTRVRSDDADPLSEAIGLAQSLWEIYDAFGDLASLDASIEAFSSALLLCPTNRHRRHAILGNLGCAYLGKFKHSDDVADLDTCINVCLQALELYPKGDNERIQSLTHMAQASFFRYARNKNVQDKDAAIECIQEAIRHDSVGGSNRTALTQLLDVAQDHSSVSVQGGALTVSREARGGQRFNEMKAQ